MNLQVPVHVRGEIFQKNAVNTYVFITTADMTQVSVARRRRDAGGTASAPVSSKADDSKPFIDCAPIDCHLILSMPRFNM